uniref:LuxR C-terminal-related transcriptional regulator n=1 Tax=Phocaeicola coprocola TaxID=310298 RepID=UPI003FF0982F
MLQEDNRVNYPITRREQDIIEYLSHGMTEKEIGEKLFISPKTVLITIWIIFAKR